jgi:hypothetical protein
MIDRRTFLGSTLGGLGLGIEGGVAGPQRVKPLPDNPIPATLSGFEEYEQALASSNGLEALGIPPSWSFVREGFHPLTPERSVIVPPDAADPYRYRDLSEQLKERLVRFATWRDRPYSDNKLLLILWLMDLLTSYYRVPGYLEKWADTLAKREALGTTGVGHHFGLLHQFQTTGTVELRNHPVDWWLFLFPGGIDYWESLDEQPVHAMLGHVFAVPWGTTGRFVYRVLALAAQTARAVDQASSWVEVSRMDRISAARFVNRRAAEALAKVHW